MENYLTALERAIKTKDIDFNPKDPSELYTCNDEFNLPKALAISLAIDYNRPKYTLKK